MTVVVDASVIVAALTEQGEAGRWAAGLLETSGGDVAAPHLMPVEVASVLVGARRRGTLTGDAAALAHRDLLDLPLFLHPYAPSAPRVWQLRENVAPYDAWYVALAEALEAPLATLDLRLSQAPGPRCRFLVP